MVHAESRVGNCLFLCARVSGIDHQSYRDMPERGGGGRNMVTHRIEPCITPSIHCSPVTVGYIRKLCTGAPYVKQNVHTCLLYRVCYCTVTVLENNIEGHYIQCVPV